MDKQIKTLSKEEFWLYVSKRKPLDREFTKMTINKYETNRQSAEKRAEKRKQEHKMKMETDEAYRDAYKEKTRKAYLKAKERREKKDEKDEKKDETGAQTETKTETRINPEKEIINQRRGEVENENVIERVPLEPLNYEDLLYDF